MNGETHHHIVHTPGPWAWEASDLSMTTLGTSDGNGGVDLALEVLSVSRCKSCQADPVRMRCHMPSDADARLIAAAPELLAALKEILEWIANGYDPSIYDIEEAARVVQKAETGV